MQPTVRMFPSSAWSAPRNSPSLSVEPGGACAVNPATPNLQGLGVCVYMCVFVCEKKEKVCHVYRLTGLTFHCLHTEEKVQNVHTVCPHTVYLCCFWTYLRISAAHTLWRELFQMGQVNVSGSIILYMNSPKQRGKEREPTGIRSVYGWMGGVWWHTSFNCHFSPFMNYSLRFSVC